MSASTLARHLRIVIDAEPTSSDEQVRHVADAAAALLLRRRDEQAALTTHNDDDDDATLAELLRQALDSAAGRGLRLLEAARLLGALCLDGRAVANVDELLSWSFGQLQGDNVAGQLHQLVLLRQLLLAGGGQQHRATSTAAAIVSNVDVLLRNAASTEVLDDALSLLETAAQLYPAAFAQKFLAVMNTLIGWRLDINVPTALSTAIGQRMVEHFAGVWSTLYPAAALDLLDKFLLDMDFLSTKCDDHHVVYKSLERFSLCFLMLVECLSPDTLARHAAATGSLLSRLFTHCFSQRSAALRKTSAAVWIIEKWHNHCVFVVSKLCAHAGHAFAPAFSACLKFMHSHLVGELAQSPSHSSVLHWLRTLTDVVQHCGAFLPVAAVLDLLKPTSPFQTHVRARFLAAPPIVAALAGLYLALLRSTMAFSQPVVFQSLSAEFTAALACPPPLPPDRHRLLLFNIALCADKRCAALLLTDARALHTLLSLLLQLLADRRLPDELRVLVVRTLASYTALSTAESSSDDDEAQLRDEGRQVLASMRHTVAQALLDQLQHSRASVHVVSPLLDWLAANSDCCTARQLTASHAHCLVDQLGQPAAAQLLLRVVPFAHAPANERLAALLLRHPQAPLDPHCRLGLLARLLVHLPSLVCASRVPPPPLPLPAPLPLYSRAQALLRYLLSAERSTPAPAWTRVDVDELVRECLETRLATAIGRPQDLFEALEQALRCGGDAAHLYWLVQFGNTLERAIRLLTAHEPTAFASLNAKVLRFFVDHQQVCANWFFRMRHSLLRAACASSTCPADVLLQSRRALSDPYPDLPVAVADALFALRDADSLHAMSASARWARPLALHAAGRLEEALEEYDQLGRSAAHLQQHREHCQQALASWDYEPAASFSELLRFGSGLPAPATSWLLQRDDLAPAQIEPLLCQHADAAQLPPGLLLANGKPSPFLGPRDPRSWRFFFASADADLTSKLAALSYLRKCGNLSLAEHLLRAQANSPSSLSPSSSSSSPLSSSSASSLSSSSSSSSSSSLSSSSSSLSSTPSLLFDVERVKLSYSIASASYAADSSQCLLQLGQMIKSQRAHDAASLVPMYLLQGKWIQQQRQALLQDASSPFMQRHAALFRPAQRSGGTLTQLAQLLGYDRQPVEPFELAGHCYEKAASLASSSVDGDGLKAWQRFADFAYARALALLPSQLDASGETILLSEAEKAAVTSGSEAAVTQLWTLTSTNEQPSHLRLLVRHRVLSHFYLAAAKIGKLLQRPDGASRQYAVRLLTLLVHFGGGQDDLSALLAHTFAETACSVWTDLLPQILVWLGHESASVRDVLAALLTRIGDASPRRVVYSVLAVLARKPRSAHQERARAEVKNVCAALQERHSGVFVAARTVFAELCRVSELHEERWYRILKGLLHQSPAKEAVVQRMEALRGDTLLRAPETPHERAFVASFRGVLDAALDDVAVAQTTDAVHKVLNRLIGEFAAARRSSALLSALSPALLDATDVPALPWIDCSDGGDDDELAAFLPDVAILPTKTRPRKLSLRGRNGRVHSLLLKGGEDLRMDERMMQWLRAANACLALDRPAAARGLHAKHYAVVPLTERVGLIEWVDGGEQLFALYTAFEQQQRRQQRSGDSKTTAAAATGDDGQRGKSFVATKKYHAYAAAALQEAGYDATLPRSSWPLDVQRGVFAKLRDETPSELLFDALWRRSGHAMAWWETTVEYTRTLAVMSMIGHVIGLGDRHLDNMLIDYRSGELMHIDYNVCFEKGKRLSVPETVPFRLTQNLQQAVALQDVASDEGQFARACRLAFAALCAHQETLVGLLDTFIYDPIVDWELPAQHKSDQRWLLADGAEPGCDGAQPPAHVDAFVANVRDYYHLLVVQMLLRLLSPASSSIAQLLNDLAARSAAHQATIARCTGGGGKAGGKRKKHTAALLAAPPVNAPPAAGVLQAQVSVLRRSVQFDGEFVQRCESIERQVRLLDEERQCVARELHQLLSTRLRDPHLPALCCCPALQLPALRGLLAAAAAAIDHVTSAQVAAAAAELAHLQPTSPSRSLLPHSGDLAALSGRLTELQQQVVQTETLYQQTEDFIHRQMTESHTVSAQDVKRFEARIAARRQSARDKQRAVQPLVAVAHDYIELEACRASAADAAELLSCLDDAAALVALKEELAASSPCTANAAQLKVAVDTTLRDMQLLAAQLPAQTSFVAVVHQLADELSITHISPSPKRLQANWSRVRQLLARLPDDCLAAVAAHNSSSSPSSSASKSAPVTEPTFLADQPLSSLLAAALNRGARSVLRYHSAGKNPHAQEALLRIQEKLSVPQEAVKKHVRSLIDQAVAVDNLCRNYEGWFAWF